MTQPAFDPSRLLPAPRRASKIDGSPVDLSCCAYEGPLGTAATRLLEAHCGTPEPSVTVRTTLEPSVGIPGSYTIEASGESINIIASDEAGVRHAPRMSVQAEWAREGGLEESLGYDQRVIDDLLKGHNG